MSISETANDARMNTKQALLRTAGLPYEWFAPAAWMTDIATSILVEEAVRRWQLLAV